jgi:hypothetical protein
LPKGTVLGPSPLDGRLDLADTPIDKEQNPSVAMSAKATADLCKSLIENPTAREDYLAKTFPTEGLKDEALAKALAERDAARPLLLPRAMALEPAARRQYEALRAKTDAEAQATQDETAKPYVQALESGGEWKWSGSIIKGTWGIPKSGLPGVDAKTKLRIDDARKARGGKAADPNAEVSPAEQYRQMIANGISPERATKLTGYQP